MDKQISPLPWRLADNGCWIIDASGNNVLALANLCEHNVAALIVRAVNAHASCVEAMKAALAAGEAAKAKYLAMWTSDDALMDKLRAALAIAEGGAE